MRSVLGLIHFHHVLQSQHPFHRSMCLGARRFGDQTLLEWVVGRVLEAQHLDQVAVLMPGDVDKELAIRIGPRVTILPQMDLGTMKDFARAIEQCDADGVVLVGIERPFIDPNLIDELVLSAHATTADYAVFHSRPEFRQTGSSEAKMTQQAAPQVPGLATSPETAVSDPIGIAAEWCSRKALEVSVREQPTCLATRETWVRWIANQADRFTVQQFNLPPALDRHDLRLAVENAEDWEHAHMIYEALGRDDLHWPRLTQLLDQQPEIRQRMARLNDAEHGVARPHVADRSPVALN